ncbi:PREDICTED: uncharacterized protein LOC106816135 [Priapulus caudatus]|uniref:Uncharacterized protein LOC106816135 n=1 Tax=Priapulus caudatus TaxID=37621 RepID=A0ABM1EVF6_PRICU|nr:PREDICTED: uncharacterized protein LOC106816135 [Priapulus caudatus]
MTAPGLYYQYEGITGAGYYSEVMIGCRQVTKQASQLCLDAIDAVPFSGNGCFLLVDFATADGGNSMELIKFLIDALRKKHGHKFDIQVIHEDQPSNDWTSFFKRVQGMISEPESYLVAHPDVQVFACGTSFYEKCFSNNSVHFAFSAAGMDILSKQ